MTEEKKEKKEKDWSGRILVVGCVLKFATQAGLTSRATHTSLQFAFPMSFRFWNSNHSRDTLTMNLINSDK